MRCPHCGTELLYRQRNGRKCSSCKQKFAFEPKVAPLRMHDERFKRLISQISEAGTLRYTPDQLRYAASRKAVREQRHRPILNVIGGVVVVGILAFIAVFLASFIAVVLEDVGGAAASVAGLITIGLPVLVFVIGFVVVLLRAGTPPGMPISLPDFNRKIINQWQKLYGNRPAGMIDEQTRQQVASAMPAPRHMRAVVVCPQRDVLDSLKANGIAERLELGMLPAQPPFSPAEEGILTMLRNTPDLPLLLLHDASVEGCLLSRMIQRRLGLNPEHKVNDLGLRPAQVVSRGMLHLKTQPNAKLLQALKQRTAPEGLSRDTNIERQGYLLFYEEFEWLKQGNYSPVTAVTPARLIRVVTQAVERFDHRPRQAAAALPTDPEQRARAQAQAVGFMSWPSA